MNETTAVLSDVVNKSVTYKDAITIAGVSLIILMFILGIAVAVVKHKDKKEGKLR